MCTIELSELTAYIMHVRVAAISVSLPSYVNEEVMPSK